MQRRNFRNEVKRILGQNPIKRNEYYALTLLGNEDGTVTRLVQTQFAGYTETRPPREIREASFVYPEKMVRILKEIGESCVVVNDGKDLVIFRLLGGHAVIEKTLAERFFSDLIKPRETAYSYAKGILNVKNLPLQTLQHALTKKLRMKILTRDGYRCKICGRSPKDYVDVELHVHHITPWGQGGLTEEENLITLCGTCHGGLDPHFNLDLYGLIDIDPIRDRIRNAKTNCLSGVSRYQQISREQWKVVKPTVTDNK